MAKEENKKVEALGDEAMGNVSGGSGIGQFNNILNSLKDAKKQEERNRLAKYIDNDPNNGWDFWKTHGLHDPYDDQKRKP